MTGSKKWVSANEAALQLAATLGSKKIAKDTLIELIRDKELTVKADEVTRPYCFDTGDELERPALYRNLIIPHLEWWSGRNWDKDVKAWNWRSGIFYITWSKSPLRQTVMRGVKFLAADVDNLKARKRSQASPKRGRPANVDLWAKQVSVLIEMAHKGRLQPGCHIDAKSLLDEVASRMGDTEPNSTLEKITPVLFQRFVKLDRTT